MSLDLEAILAQAEQVKQRAKERYSSSPEQRSNYVPGPSYDIQIPRFGQSKMFKYEINGTKIAGKKMTGVIMRAQSTFMRWGNRDHDPKKGPYCSVRGYHDPVSGEKILSKHWELPRGSVAETILAYKPFGTRRDEETGDFLTCSSCRERGMNTSDIPTKINSVDRCDYDSFLEIVVFKHMIETEDGVLYRPATDEDGKVGAYLAKLPVPNRGMSEFTNFVFNMATSRKMTYDQIPVEIKIDEEKIKSGALIATLEFRDLDPDTEKNAAAVRLAHTIYNDRKDKAKAAYEEKKKASNPVSQSSRNTNTNPF